MRNTFDALFVLKFRCMFPSLILLLQSMSKFMDQNVQHSNRSPQQSNKNNTSIGLVVKKFWNKIVHSHTVLSQAHSDVSLFVLHLAFVNYIFCRIYFLCFF